jgi:nicotinate-nucleotide adenylyltransferase
LLGGTFDPIHVGHLIVAEALKFRLGIDHVVFLPAANPPHKTGQYLAPAADRLEMIRLSLCGADGFSVSQLDLRRSGPSYTADMLTEIRAGVSDATELYFLMGMDSFRDFPRWYRPGTIGTLARLGVARRPGVDVSVIDVEQQVPETSGKIEIVNVPLIDISSSDIRERVRINRPFRFHVTPTVADYIIDHGLYRYDG